MLLVRLPVDPGTSRIIGLGRLGCRVCVSAGCNDIWRSCAYVLDSQAGQTRMPTSGAGSAPSEPHSFYREIGGCTARSRKLYLLYKRPQIASEHMLAPRGHPGEAGRTRLL
jgi:hypothetical protein